MLEEEGGCEDWLEEDVKVAWTKNEEMKAGWSKTAEVNVGWRRKSKDWLAVKVCWREKTGSRLVGERRC